MMFFLSKGSKKAANQWLLHLLFRVKFKNALNELPLYNFLHYQNNTQKLPLSIALFL
jgi:hypothetical protein